MLPAFDVTGSFFSTITADDQVSFNPQAIIVALSGELAIAATVSGTPLTHTVTQVSVIGNSADHFVLQPESSGPARVTRYKMTVSARDASDQIATYYTGNKSLTWTTARSSWDY